jgi:hypothetical protein
MEAHENSSTDQWPMAAAHKASSILYECNIDGIVTDMKRRCVMPADVVGWSKDVHGGWVGKVALMSELLTDTEGATPKTEVRRRSPSHRALSDSVKLLDYSTSPWPCHTYRRSQKHDK